MRRRSHGNEVDAFTVDSALAALRERLDSTGDDLLRLIDLMQFADLHVRRLHPSHHAASFVLETVDLYESLLNRPFDPSGLSPDLLDRASAILSDLISTEKDPALIERGSRSSERLAILSACQFIIAGSYEDALRVLALSGADIPGEPAEADSAQTWMRGLIRIRYPQHIAWTDGILDHTRRWWYSEDRRCCFPATFELPGPGGDRLKHGYLRMLSLDVVAGTADRDRLSLAFAVDSDASRYLDPVITAGRTVISSLTPDAARRSYRGGFRIAKAHAAHAGHSAGLAMAALFVSEVQYCTDQRSRSAVDRRVALTGSVDESGKIRPVSQDSLEAKLEAVFFSPAEIFVLPGEQLPEITGLLGKLKRRFPRRRLVLLGKESLMDVFSDRRIVTIRERSRIHHAVVRFWHTKWAVSAVVTSVMLVLLWLGLSRFNIDRHPASLTISDLGVQLTNQDGDVLWARNVSPLTVQQNYRNTPSAPLSRLQALTDLTGDGYKDAVWVEYPGNANDPTTVLHLLDGASLELMWEPRPLGFEIDYPYDISINDGNMRLVDLVVADVTADGLPEIILSVQHHSYYPSIIAVVNPRTGEIYEGYHHAGSISQLAAVDINDDSIPEILGVGTNNSYNAAVFVVLDSRRIAGVGPAEEMYRQGRPPTFNELAYFRLPVTPLAAFTGLPYSRGLRVDAVPALRRIRIQTQDLRDMTVTNDGPTGLRWEFDYELKPVVVGTDDPFDNAWTRALEADVVDRPIDNQYKIGLLRSVLMWTPDGWMRAPLSDEANLPPGERDSTAAQIALDASSSNGLSASITDGRD